MNRQNQYQDLVVGQQNVSVDMLMMETILIHLIGN